MIHLTRSRQVAEARARAVPLLGALGFPIDGWKIDVLSRRNDRHMQRVVLRFRRADHSPLVAKVVFAPKDSVRFERAALRQQEVARSFPKAVAIHGFDASAQVLLMAQADGQTLRDLCAQSPVSDHGHALAIAGGWLDAFHRSTAWEERRFQPGFTRKHLEGVQRSLECGTLQLPHRETFARLLEHTLQTIPAPNACQTRAAISHGDFNTRNLLIEGEDALGLDFGTPGMLPVGHDLARIFCHYAALFPGPGDAPHGPLPGVDLSRFFDRYTLTSPNDETVRFLCRARLLRDWQALPQRWWQRTHSQQARLNGIAILADRILAEEAG